MNFVKSIEELPMRVNHEGSQQGAMNNNFYIYYCCDKMIQTL